MEPTQVVRLFLYSRFPNCLVERSVFILNMEKVGSRISILLEILIFKPCIRSEVQIEITKNMI